MLTKKALIRSVRYNPFVERVSNAFRRKDGVTLDEIDLFVPATVGDVIIDAGANVGAITSKCARTGATVHAFEPNPLCYQILKSRFAAQPNVRIYNMGLMDKDCTLTLSTPVPHREYDRIDTTVAASFVAENFDADVTKVEVKCIDISEFVRGLGQPVALLKMDIEGAEIETLNRLLDTGVIEQIKMAVVETHERFSPKLAHRTEALRERLKAEGYSDRVRLDWL